jgi:hypothetical protein
LHKEAVGKSVFCKKSVVAQLQKVCKKRAVRSVWGKKVPKFVHNIQMHSEIFVENRHENFSKTIAILE